MYDASPVLEALSFDSSVEHADFSTAKACSAACNLLKRKLNNKVSLPNSTFYSIQPSTYWSNFQAEVAPSCYVEPADSEDVATILRTVEATNCSFAVRSGGHASFAGASNIENGITISLNKLHEVKVSDDQTTTYVGSGNTWQQVYEKLSPMALAVIGGRVAAIGVGGLTLGGGISFFSGRHGWACDNVKNYEVVVAGGHILQVNHSSYPDLYWALRGGGNNFGIVTRFDLVTFPHGMMWGGMVIYSIAQNASLFKAFEDFAYNSPKDPDAAVILSFAYADGYYIAASDYEYAKPVVNPPILRGFTAIQPNLSSTMRITTLPNLTQELNVSNPGGFRETYWAATFAVDTQLLGEILDIWVAEVEKIKDAKGILPALVLQAITKDQVAHMSKSGGNALGLDDIEAPLLLMNLAIMWSSPSDDFRILSAAAHILARSRAIAAARGLNNRYIYQNYAAKSQDVFAGYGEANVARLIRISKKYDPKGVFQRLQPGYFKLPKTDE